MENQEIGEALFNDLECRGLALSKRILFVTDGGSGLPKALRERSGKKLVQKRCVIHTNRNLQRHLAKSYRNEPYRKLTTALEQTRWAGAKQMPRDPSQCYRRARSRPSSRWSGTASGLFTRHKHTRERSAPAVTGDSVD